MKLKNARLLLKANKSYSIQKPRYTNGVFYLKFAFITRNTFSPNIFLIDFRL